MELVDWDIVANATCYQRSRGGRGKVLGVATSMINRILRTAALLYDDWYFQ
jgi:hypothetical protein